MTSSIAAIMDSVVDRIAPAAVSASPDLDPFDRMLLTADGTVTTLLEASTGEQIVTRATRQAGPASIDRLLTATGRWWHPDDGLLDLAPTDQLIVRRVSLRGASSGVAFVLAESLVVPDRLPSALAERLHRDGASLGRLLAADQVEARRDLLHVDAVQAGEACEYLAVRPDARLWRRTYTIVTGRRTVAAVTEWLVPGRLAAQSRLTVARGARLAGGRSNEGACFGFETHRREPMFGDRS